MKNSIFLLLWFQVFLCQAQQVQLSGKVLLAGVPLEYVSLALEGTSMGVFTDSTGHFSFQGLAAGNYQLRVSSMGYKTAYRRLKLQAGEPLYLVIELQLADEQLAEVVVSGTLQEVSKLESPVPVEVFKPAYFQKNPTPSIFEALQNVNGLRPQINCNVCNTGDIHINGMEGPYTLVLIDGMPIVSSLSSVYGLSGIPNALVERIEVVKGPASSLYGSEAVGGLINIITKNPKNAPVFSAESFVTSWQELSTDLGFKANLGDGVQVLTGLNYFNYQNKIDRNQDNFTDVTLQNRISIFQKWALSKPKFGQLNLAARYLYEDRWGGDMRWNKSYRGGDEIYGESIYTKRWELLGNYKFPGTEKILLTYSLNDHRQDSRYGVTSYIARQNVNFTQLTWNKSFGSSDVLAGMAMRHTYYLDNTPATAAQSAAQKNTYLPGIFVQNELALTDKQKLLLGLRLDHHSAHGEILTPRIAYKFSPNPFNILRLNTGTGFRVVNIFTEDHAALTGARVLAIKNELQPERSYNLNLNYTKRIFLADGHLLSGDASLFYTYFHNRIVADYESDPNQIIYDNLSGFAQSKGIALNLDFTFSNGMKIMAGGTLMDNSLHENGNRTRQILTENFTGVWSVSVPMMSEKLAIDYTGNLYSPMRLPLLSHTDPRLPYSPWWSIQNIQFTYKGWSNLAFFGGLKNLLNWTPNRGNPFIIARAHDPFDRQVEYGVGGEIKATETNPYALSFDPSYVFGPNQGIRSFVGFRLQLN